MSIQESSKASLLEPDRAGIEARWNATEYPLWHGQAKMHQKLARSGPADVLVRGDGCWVEDAAGRRYLDARSGACNMQLGYSRTDIVRAMAEQAERLPFGCVIRYDHPADTTLQYARELVAAAPAELTRVRFTHMGSASVENALQIARLYQQNLGYRDRAWIISLRRSFHGTTFLTLAASGEDFVELVLPGLPPFLARADVPDFGSCAGCNDGLRSSTSCTDPLKKVLREIGPEHVAAFIVEPVMEGNVVSMTPHFLSEVRALADEHGFLVIYDEVTTGFGRLGELFGADLFGITPDMLCSAKGITAGYAPLGAVLVNDKVYDAFDSETGYHFPNGSSMDGHPVSCAAARVALSAYLHEGPMANARAQGDLARRLLREQLRDVEVVTDIRGQGLLMGVEFAVPAGPSPQAFTRRVEDACNRNGVLVQHGHNMIVIYPPLIITRDEIHEMVNRIEIGIREALVSI